MACGGGNWGGSTSVEIFDTEKGEWNDGPQLSCSLSEHSLVLAGNKVVAVGGNSDSVFAFNIEGNSWESFPNAPSKRNRVGLAFIEPKRLIAIGGNTGTFTNSCDEFDMEEGAWKPKEKVPPMMPTSRYDFGVQVIGNRIFAIGGYNDKLQTKANEVFDIEENIWRILSPMPTARQGMAIGCIDGRHIWTFGGYLNGNDLDVIEVYDTVTDEWSVPPVKMTTKRYSSKAVVIGEKFFIVGGRENSSNPTNLLEIFDPETMKWTQAPPMKLTRMWHGVAGF